MQRFGLGNFYPYVMNLKLSSAQALMRGGINHQRPLSNSKHTHTHKKKRKLNTYFSQWLSQVLHISVKVMLSGKEDERSRTDPEEAQTLALVVAVAADDFLGERD